MPKGFEAIQVTDKVYWVGVLDRDLADFHGYSTPNGSTYNAYLILDETVVLIDTVKKHLFREMIERISSIIAPEKIDIIVSNHSEMDHVGALKQAIDTIKPKKVLASKMGKKNITAQLGDLDVQSVENGEELNTGSLTLKFLETRMLHWPDSMVTYIPELKILFSQDIMGMHLATEFLFADDVSEEILYREAAKYYANIIMPYSKIVLGTLNKLTQNGVDPKIIAPDHGPIWNNKQWVEKIFSYYEKWAKMPYSRKAVIVYDTMWGSTSCLAKAIADGLREGGCKPIMLAPLSTTHRSDVAEELLDAGALIVGSPTINNQIFPAVADVMTYLKGLKPQNLIGASFGSYGWSGEAPKQLAEFLESMNIEVVDTLRVHFVPSKEDFEKAHELGLQVAKRLLEKIEEQEKKLTHTTVTS